MLNLLVQAAVEAVQQWARDVKQMRMGILRCQCTFCSRSWRILRRRIVRCERFFEIEKGQPFVWDCHDCHEGVVVPGKYRNSHGEIVDFDPDNLPRDVIVLHSWPAAATSLTSKS